jgi:hypothetical protein
MVTAGKDAYTTASVVDFDARDVTLSLIPLTPSPPGSGTGRGPQPLPDGVLTGRVQGFDKYIIPPLGSCATKLGAGGALANSLCSACVEDSDCAGAGSRCTLLGEQGKRCTTACETASDCPSGFMCAGVGFGAGAVRALAGQGGGVVRHDDGRRVQRHPIGCSRRTGFTDAESNYALDSRPGEHAVVCMGGYLDPDSGEFVPLRMGVRRHVFTVPGETLSRAGRRRWTSRCRGPCGSAWTIRPRAPARRATTRWTCFWTSAATASSRCRSSAAGIEQDRFELPGFPEKFEESLYDASYIDLRQRADRQHGGEGLSNDGSFTLHKGITAVNDDGVFEVFPTGAAVTRTGITHDVLGDARHRAMGGCGRWATPDASSCGMGPGGRCSRRRRPRPCARCGGCRREDAWAAGDGGAVLRYNGLIWRAVTMPAQLAGANWWGLTGELGKTWLIGDRGVWMWDAVSDGFTQVYTGPGPAAAWRGIWSDGASTVWVVGDDGRIRRIGPAGTDVLDVQGDDLLAVSGATATDVWAVGRRGRIVHWDGQRWFDYLPKTRRDLHAVHMADSATVWATGDAGGDLALGRADLGGAR